MGSIIEFQNVSFDYINHEGLKKRALNNISLEVDKGEFLAIVGSNGSGKSTLAKHINALLLPAEGTVHIDGYDTSDEEKLWDIRRTAGMVFQNPDNQLVATIVEEDIAFGAENLGLPREEIIKRVDDSLEMVEMNDYRGKAPHMLSGGQKQRVAIAGVLALNPKIIVFDESTAMLDPKGRREVMDIAMKLNKGGKTIIFITHFMEEAALADRVVILNEGEIAKDGTPQEIFSNIALLDNLCLDVPKSVLLADQLRKSGMDIKNVFSIEEMAEEICSQL
ncbi:MAG: energy-coupling factor transporter ATPase [Clostridia bacterium]|nr:energy-coupling factor transporter ATPase [Clostridia bacterium]